jgi:enoyl-CoA hydratase/carnithine racemase
LCGERISAEKAHQIGLVEEVVEKGEALNAAIALAKQVEEQSPSSVAACKSLIQQTRSGTISAALPLERELFVRLFDTQDQKEGVNAFLEKRKANWVNG